MKSYRNWGAIGALLDEYEKALNDLYVVLENIKSNDLHVIVDRETSDEDCRSIQTILSHLVRSGYTYLAYFEQAIGLQPSTYDKRLLTTTAEYIEALKEMFCHTEEFFKSQERFNDGSFNSSNTEIHSGWGEVYSMEQLFEHALVHILRHRRQIERFLIILGK